METLSTYNIDLDKELTIKFTMFFGQFGYIGLNYTESKTLDSLVRRFKSCMDNNFYSLAESMLSDMYTLCGLDFKNM